MKESKKLTTISWKEASDMIDEYLADYIPPKILEDALSVAKLALARCDFMDELNERRERERKNQ